jgi:hypothetical protein
VTDASELTARNYTGELPQPLVKLRRNPLKWIWNKLQLLTWAIVFSYIGLLVAAGAYYAITQTTTTMDNLWHSIVPNDELRHDIRDIGEGVLGGFLGQQIIWNHFRRRRPMNRLDRFEERWHIANLKDGKPLSGWQVLASPWLGLLYGIPGFTVVYIVVELFERNPEAWWYMLQLMDIERGDAESASKLVSFATDNWQDKLKGFAAAYFFGRRPAKGVFDDFQVWFIKRRVYNDHPVPRWYPPTYRAHYEYGKSHYDVTKADLHPLRLLWVRTLLVLGVIFAGFGWYVLTFIAP